MHFGDTEVCQLVESIWALVLGREVQPVEAPTTFERDGRFLTGCVTIAGAWEGAVILDCAAGLAQQAAGVMFDTAVPDDEATRDAIGELTNMVAGNLKALLPGPSFLGLPTVANGREYAIRVTDSQLVLRVVFESEALPIVVSVVQRQSNEPLAA